MVTRPTITFPVLTSQDLSAFLTEQGIEYSMIGPKNNFQGVAQLGRCEAHHLIWSKTLNDAVRETPARVVLLPQSAQAECDGDSGKTFFFVETPREAFRVILTQLFFQQYNAARGFFDPALFEEIRPTVWVSPAATVAQDVQMGRNVVIHPGVVIYPNVSLGDNVEICAGCIVGAPGFGHVRQPDGTLEHFPHIGGVTIGNNVTVGSNTCIDSGGLSPTVIGNGCKIGNLTQIAHNVELDENCLIGTRCQVAGGTKIGQRTEVWAGVTISNNRRIGTDCNIKIGSIVITHLSDGAVVSGNFAVAHEKRLREFREERLSI